MDDRWWHNAIMMKMMSFIQFHLNSKCMTVCECLIKDVLCVYTLELTHVRIHAHFHRVLSLFRYARQLDTGNSRTLHIQFNYCFCVFVYLLSVMHIKLCEFSCAFSLYCYLSSECVCLFFPALILLLLLLFFSFLALFICMLQLIILRQHFDNR